MQHKDTISWGAAVPVFWLNTVVVWSCSNIMACLNSCPVRWNKRMSLPVWVFMLQRDWRPVAESLRRKLWRWWALPLHTGRPWRSVGGSRGRGGRLRIGRWQMMYCPLSFVHKSFARLRISLCRVGGDKGGVTISGRRAAGVDFTLRTGGGLVGLWASLSGRLLQHRGFPPRSRWRLVVAVVPGLRESTLSDTVWERCGSVVLGGRSSSVSAVRVGSCHGRRGWRWVMFKLLRLFSDFTVTGPSVREAEEHNRKLLITQPGSMDYHLQLYQIIHCGGGLVPRSSSHYDYASMKRHTAPSLLRASSLVTVQLAAWRGIFQFPQSLQRGINNAPVQRSGSRSLFPVWFTFTLLTLWRF